MQPIHFEEVVEGIIKKDPRFHRDAYLFLREALDFTQIKVARRSRRGSKKRSEATPADREEPRHVTGAELMEGLRDYGLEQFGPMTRTVFEEWGVTCTRHFGEIVFNLIGEGLLSKKPEDKLEDFENIYNFEEAFCHPFLPGSKLGKRPGNPDVPLSN